MFERFTDRARRSLALARELSKKYKHEDIHCEHLLIGIIDAGNSFLHNHLNDIDLFSSSVTRELVLMGYETYDEDIAKSQPPIADNVKEVLESSWDVARDLKLNYISCDMILVGLINSGCCADTFSNFGVTSNMIIRSMKEYTSSNNDQMVDMDTVALSILTKSVKFAVEEESLLQLGFSFPEYYNEDRTNQIIKLLIDFTDKMYKSKKCSGIKLIDNSSFTPSDETIYS